MTAYLLDSHIFIWLQTDRSRLKASLVAEIASTANEAYLSIVSVIELFDKFSKRGGTGLDHVLARGAEALEDDLDEAGLKILPIEVKHAAVLRALPVHHRDPFDRLLIAQAISEGLTMVSGDRAFERYDGLRLVKCQ
ncbi:MAG: type II toxin-antitoxin system VapC family toxin [Parvularculaceae bacterium]